MRTLKANRKVWQDSFVLDIYEYAKGGMSKQKIMRTMGIYPATFYKWMKNKPLMKEAFLRGRRSRKSVETFKEYIYARLPKKLRKIWRKINAIDRKDVNGIERIQTILRDQGRRAKQHLWLHCYITANFNASEACRIMCISRQAYEDWYLNDPEFHELFDGMLKVKKDFFEGALVGKINEGDISAILFANKTLNADRGYGNKLQVEHSGQIQHNVAVIRLKDLPNLSLDTRRELVAAIREQKEVKTLEHKENGNGSE